MTRRRCFNIGKHFHGLFLRTSLRIFLANSSCLVSFNVHESLEKKALEGNTFAKYWEFRSREKWFMKHEIGFKFIVHMKCRKQALEVGALCNLSPPPPLNILAIVPSARRDKKHSEEMRMENKRRKWELNAIEFKSSHRRMEEITSSLRFECRVVQTHCSRFFTRCLALIARFVASSRRTRPTHYCLRCVALRLRQWLGKFFKTRYCFVAAFPFPYHSFWRFS